MKFLYKKVVGSLFVLVLLLSFLITSINIPVVDASVGWLSGWSYRVKLTIDQDDVNLTLTNFPVLIYLSSSSGYNNDDVTFVFDNLTSDANQLKIAVTTSNGTTECYVEIEDWSDAAETAWLWFKAPSISNTSDTDFYLYYDSSHANNTNYVGIKESVPAEQVWDSYFKLVQHLDEDSGNIADSTNDDNDGSPYSNPTYRETGVIDGAIDFDGNDEFELGSDADLKPQQLTFEAWVKTDDYTRSLNGGLGYGLIFGSANNFRYKIDFHSSTARLYVADTSNVYGDAISIGDNNWHHWVITYDGANVNVYKDGSNATNPIPCSVTLSSAYDYFMLGARLNGDYGIDGDIDEVRLSSGTGSARNYGWIRATYETNRDEMLDWGGQELENPAPVNSSFIIIDMDDTNILYAQISGGYTLKYNGSDASGWEDIDYVLLNVTQATTVRFCIKYTNSSDTFSVEDGSTWVSLGSGSSSRSGAWLNLTLNFFIKFGAGDEADLELSAFIIDSNSASDTDTLQTDYCDVVSDLVASGLSMSDARGNVGATITLSGNVVYSSSALFPPDAEFAYVEVWDAGDNIEGRDSTVVNGAWSVTFTASSSVELETFNPFINMSDADYVDAEEGVTETYISDRIRITDVSSNDSWVDVDAYSTIYSTAELEYDLHTVGGGVGDNLTIEGLNMTWDAGNSWYYYEDTKSSVQNVTYDTSTGYEATYGVSVINQNTNDTWVVWDRIKILTLMTNASRIDINDVVQINATAELEFNSTALGSGDSLVISGIALSWDAGDSVFEGTDTKSSVQQVTYNVFTSGEEATFGITVGNMNGQSASCIWDRIVVYYQALNDSRVDINSAIEFRARALLDFDEHAFDASDTLTGNLGALSWDAGNNWFDGTKTEATVGDYSFLVSSGNEVTYGISTIYINVSNPTGIWDRINMTGLSVADGRIDVDDTAVLTPSGIYEYDSGAWSGVATYNDTLTQSSVALYGYRITSLTDSNYGLSVFQQSANNVSVIFDRIIILTLIADPSNLTTGSYTQINATARLEYDNHALSLGDTLTIEGLLLEWDAGDSDFKGYETSQTNSTKIYDEGTGNEATYGITVVNMDGNSVTVIWSGAAVGGWLFDLITPVTLAAIIGVPSVIGALMVRRRRR